MKPEFCPNPSCSYHFNVPQDSRNVWFKRAGFHPTKVVGPVQRFSCVICGKGFSERTFQLDFYTKKNIDYQDIYHRNASGENVSAMSRNLECSPQVILNRLERLSRNCLAMQHRLYSESPLHENLCADGFESFDRSQYFPNHISVLVGSQSQHLLAFSHTTIRRKGRMTQPQKKHRQEIEKQYRAPRLGIKTSFTKVLKIIDSKWDRSLMPELTLTTDLHTAYPAAIAGVPVLSDGKIKHQGVSSRLSRTSENPLFPVNYFDREMRKDLAALRRESTCYTRNVANGMARLSVYQVWHNFQKPFRINPQPESQPTHAVMAGIDRVKIKKAFEKVFSERVLLSRIKLPEWALDVWLKKNRTPLKTKTEYLPAFALA
jgi:hypothetical protein